MPPPSEVLDWKGHNGGVPLPDDTPWRLYFDNYTSAFDERGGGGALNGEVPFLLAGFVQVFNLFQKVCSMVSKIS